LFAKAICPVKTFGGIYCHESRKKLIYDEEDKNKM
jgi:hypothetical protein